jgi:hypothetical protein
MQIGPKTTNGLSGASTANGQATANSQATANASNRRSDEEVAKLIETDTSILKALESIDEGEKPRFLSHLETYLRINRDFPIDYSIDLARQTISLHKKPDSIQS